MRFWLSRNSSVSLREQLATQIMLGVISEDLKPGKHLPSVRELARLYGVHFNTVSAAYHDLVKRGWLDTRRGSGVYVRRLPPSPPQTSSPQTGHAPLDDLISRLLHDAQARGISAGEVRARLQTWLSMQTRERLIVAEPEPELGNILVAELPEATAIPGSHWSCPVPECSPRHLTAPQWRPSRAAPVSSRRYCPRMCPSFSSACVPCPRPSKAISALIQMRW